MDMPVDNPSLALLAVWLLASWRSGAWRLALFLF
jgi:hypothetical protein